MSGSSRKDSGAGSKSRYQSLNLAQNYKGSGHDYKSAQKRGSMQSLGKIPTTARRMPVPAQLRSLKSSNDGQDPTVALVPQGGGGWTKDEEKEREKEDPRNYTRKTERQPDPSIPEEFKSDFPSLKEQEKMSKKEREELKKRQREEEFEQQRNEGGASTPPPHPTRDHHPRKPEEAWGGRDRPPYYQGAGQDYNVPPPQFYPPHRQGMYPPPPYPPTGGGRYLSRGPHPPHHHNFSNPRYRHTHPYPPPSNYLQSHDPYNYHDPYSLPSNARERNILRDDGGAGPLHPPRDGEQEMEEDDEGWAGHQEEVDYTKEVVFEDSSDEDSPKKANKEHAKERFEKENDPSATPTGHLIEGQEPYYEPHGRRGEGSVRGHSHRRHAPPGYHHPRGHPPYMPYDYGPPYHPPPPHRGWYPPYPPREEYNPEQAPPRHWKNGRGEKPPGRGVGRHEVHPPWGPEGMHQSKRRNELPKEERIHSEAGTERPLSRTPSGDNVSPLGSLDSNQDSIPTPDPMLAHTPSPESDPSNLKNYPKKIMTRDLPERSGNGGRGDQQQPTGQRNSRPGQELLEGGNHKAKVAWGGVVSSQPMPQPPETSDEKDVPVPPPPPPIQPSQMSTKESFQALERGRVTTPKILYEPEGRASEEKFRKYQRSMSGGGGEHHTHSKPKTPSSSSISKGDNVKGDGGEVRSGSRQEDASQHGVVFVDEEEKKVVMKREEGSPLDEPKSRRDRQSKGRRDERRDLDTRGGRRREVDDLQRPIGRGERGGDRRRGSAREEPTRSGRETERGHGSSKPQPNQKRRAEDVGQTEGSRSLEPTVRTVQRQSSKPRGKSDPRPLEQDRGVSSRSHSQADSRPDSKTESKGRPPQVEQQGNNRSKPNNRHDQDQRQSDSSSRHQDKRPPPPYSNNNQDTRPPPPTNNNNRRDQSRCDPCPGRQDHEAKSSSNRTRSDVLMTVAERQSVPDPRHDPRHPQRKTQPKRGPVPPEVNDGRSQRRQDTSRPVPRRESAPVKQELEQRERIRELKTTEPAEVKQNLKQHNRPDPKPGSKESEPAPEIASVSRQRPTSQKLTESSERKKQESVPLRRKLPSDEEEGLAPEDQRGNKRRLNTREKEDERGRRRPRSGRGSGRPQREYDDDYHDRPIRRTNRGERGGDTERFSTRTFERPRRDRRGGRRGSRGSGRSETMADDRRGSEAGEGEERKEELQQQQPVRAASGKMVYTDLDEIDSPEEWGGDEVEGEVVILGKDGEEDRDRDVRPPVNKRRPHESGGTDRPRGERRRDYRGGRGRASDRNRGRRPPRRHGDREMSGEQRPHALLPDPHPATAAITTGRKEDDKSSANSRFGGGTQLQPDPPKDHNFEKYDINALNVVVVDRHGSDTEQGDHHSPVTAEEGFIEVKSKRDKQKDREEKRRHDGNQQKRGEDDSSRHRGTVGRSQEYRYQAGKGWGQMHQRKVEPQDGNEDWPINEGKSVFGAVGEKPSKDKDKDALDLNKTVNLNPNSGYKLFESEKGPFSFDPLTTPPRKGERFQAAIESTLPSSPQVRTTLEPPLERVPPNPVGSSRQNITQSSSSKTTPPNDTCIPPTNNNTRGTRETRPKNGGNADEPHPRTSREPRGDTERGRYRKPKTEQKFYTPPGARQEDRTPSSRGQRSQQSSKQQNAGEIVPPPAQSKVHRQGSGEERSNLGGEESLVVPPEQERDPREVYLQQHQDIGGHVIVVGGDTPGDGEESVSGDVDSDKPRLFHSIGNSNNNSQKKAAIAVLKTLQPSSQRPTCIPMSQSTTKFGSVSYASALKMKAQSAERVPSEGGVMIEDNVAATLLGSEMSHLHGKELMLSYSDDSETEMGVAKDSILQLRGVLDSVAVVPNEEEDVGEGGEGRNRGGSSCQFSPSVLRGGELYAVSSGLDSPLPLSPSSKFSKPLSSPCSSMGGGGGSPSSVPPLAKPPASPSFPNLPRDERVKKIMKEDTTRPSSAQSLTDSPYPGLTVSALTRHNPQKSPSPVDKVSGVPITRVSSAPSHLPVDSTQPEETEESNDEDGESVKTDDSLSTNSKSLLNIAANEFVPQNSLGRKRPGKDNPSSKPSRVYQGGRGGGRSSGGNVPMHTQHSKHSHKSHPAHFHQQQQQQQQQQPHHHHAPSQQPHPPHHHHQQQQQPLLNKPPVLPSSLLLQLLLQKNVPPNLLFSLGIPPSTVPAVSLSSPQSLSHPSLPLSYPPPPHPLPPGNIPFQLTHPGVLTQAPPPPLPSRSRKLSSQEGVANPHVMPHPPLPPAHSTTTIQYISAGSKVTMPVTPEGGGTPEITQVPNVLTGQVSTIPHSSYYSPTPLHPNPAPPPPPPPTVLVPPHHTVQVHAMPSTRPSPRVTPINTSQVHPTAVHSLSLTRPVLIEQGNSNSRPPLLPTPPGFSLVHQTTVASTPSVTTPPSTIHHGNWPMGIRMSLPPNVQSHDQPTLIQYHSHMPPSNSV